MYKLILSILSIALSLTAHAQSLQDSTIYKGYLYNSEYEVYLNIDFYNNLAIPNQEVYGKLPGYFGDIHDGRKWLIVSAKIILPSKKKLSANTSTFQASLDIINDYGSEDLTATLTYNSIDKTYILTQIQGSNIKIARNRKWIKMPKILVFKRQ